MCGSRRRGAVSPFPEDCIQFFVDEWWVEDSSRDVRPGSLLKAFAAYPEPTPYVLTGEGRRNDRDHSTRTSRSRLTGSPTHCPDRMAISRLLAYRCGRVRRCLSFEERFARWSSSQLGAMISTAASQAAREGGKPNEHFWWRPTTASIATARAEVGIPILFPGFAERSIHSTCGIYFR